MAVQHLQKVYNASLAYHRSPQDYMRVSYKFVDFAIKKQTFITAPKGLYLYGGVGTGKTFLMDLFYEVGREGGEV